MARSSSLISLLISILALISLVQASFRLTTEPRGEYRIQNNVGFITAQGDSRVNIDPSARYGVIWELIPTGNGNHFIRQAGSDLYLSPAHYENPYGFDLLVVTPNPQEWTLRAVEGDDSQFFIEWPQPIEGETLVIGQAPFRVYPPLASLLGKGRTPYQTWMLQELSVQRSRHRLNRLECQDGRL